MSFFINVCLSIDDRVHDWLTEDCSECISPKETVQGWNSSPYEYDIQSF